MLHFFHFESNYNWSVVAFGLVMASIALAWLSGIALGGFKIGSLERRVEHRMTREESTPFWERMCQRLLQIGFVPSTDGVFIQKGSQFGDLSSLTHAKTKKEFRATAYDNGDGITMQLSLRYLDPIVGDTGESAYRDSVLDFVSGQSDGIKTVSNRSFAAVCSLVGGIVACVALIWLKTTGHHPIWPPIVTLGSAQIVTGALAIRAIRTKPGELKGLPLALAGIGLSCIAVLGAVVMEFVG